MRLGTILTRKLGLVTLSRVPNQITSQVFILIGKTFRLRLKSRLILSLQEANSKITVFLLISTTTLIASMLITLGLQEFSRQTLR